MLSFVLNQDITGGCGEENQAPDDFYTAPSHVRVGECSWFCASWQSSHVPGGSRPQRQPVDSTGHRVGYLDPGWMGGFPTPGCHAVMQLHKMLLLL